MSRQRSGEDGAYTFVPWVEALDLALAKMNGHAAAQMVTDASGTAACNTERLPLTAEPALQDSTELTSMGESPVNVR